MKQQFIPLLLLCAVIVTGVFGLLLMGIMVHEGMPCPIGTMARMDCSVFTNPVSMAAHHASMAEEVLLLAVAVCLVFVVKMRAVVRRIAHAHVGSDRIRTFKHVLASREDSILRYFNSFHSWRARLIGYGVRPVARVSSMR